jgi:hypothetical protein
MYGDRVRDTMDGERGRRVPRRDRQEGTARSPATPDAAPGPSGRWFPGAGKGEGTPARVLDLSRLLLGITVVTLGTLFLLDNADVLEGDAWDYVWPVAIILAGLLIVARWNGRAVPGGADREDVIRSTAIFAGPKLVSTAPALQGAWLTAIVGGITLDLRDACPPRAGRRSTPPRRSAGSTSSCPRAGA